MRKDSSIHYESYKRKIPAIVTAGGLKSFRQFSDDLIDSIRHLC